MSLPSRRAIFAGLFAAPLFPAIADPQELHFPVKIHGSAGYGAIISIKIQDGRIVSARVLEPGSNYDDPLGAAA